MECGSAASAHAEADASALQTGQRAAPLSHLVGEGLGVKAESRRTLHTANSSDVPLAKIPPTLKLTLQHSKQVCARLPSPTWWERGWG